MVVIDGVINIAVIMPYKNSGSTIFDSASSVLIQTIRGCIITLICVDDGSTDNSNEQLGFLSGVSYARRLVRLSGLGLGPAQARNIALDYIRNADSFDYVAFCDSDDVWHPWHLLRSIAQLQGDADMVYSEVECKNEHGEELTIYGIPTPPEFDYDFLKAGNYIFISTVVMTTNVVEDIDFDPNFVPMEDWHYWLQVGSKYRIKRIHASSPGVVYMWKTTGSYYTADQSNMAKQKIINTMVKDPMNVEGWLSKAEGEFLAKTAQGKKCIEIGSYKGKSTCFIAPVAHSIVCIDTFKADYGGQAQMSVPTTYVDFAANTAHLKNVTPLIGMSQDVHQFLKDDFFDFIFIDGMHDYESVMSDLVNYLPKLREDSVIMFHDYFLKDWPGVVAVVDTVFGGPDKLVDSVAMVQLTAERRVLLATKLQNQIETSTKTSNFPLQGKTIVIAPWAAALPDGKVNPKNYPYWKEVIGKLHALGAYTIQIGRPGESLIGCAEIMFNLDDDRLLSVLNNSDTFISVDSFLPHFAAYHNKKGVVIFGQSDPEIFGHSTHLNLLKSREYLRPDQFRWWHDVTYVESAFVAVNEVVTAVISAIDSREIYNELS